MFDRPPSNRRDFFRSLLGRAAESVPEGVAGAATAMARGGGTAASAPGVPDEDTIARALAVPPEQRDLADALVRHGRMREVAEGRYAELFAFGPPPGGPATAQWLDRVRQRRPPERMRPRDVMLVEAARTELRRG